MKNILFISFFTFFSSVTFACQNIKEKKSENKELILKLKPEIIYDENSKYEEPKIYDNTKKEKKSNLDIDVNVDVNKEERTIDKLKLDMGTNF